MWRVVVVFCGCGRIAFDPTAGTSAGDGSAMVPRDGSGAPSDGNSGPGDSAGSDAAMACAICPAGNSVMIAQTTNLGLSGSIGSNLGLSSSCGGTGSEFVEKLIVQQTGHYTFQVTSGGLSLLYVNNTCCTGAQIGCSTTGTVSVALATGQTAALVIDGGTQGQALMFQIVGGP